MKKILFILALATTNIASGWACFICGDSPENYKYYNICNNNTMPTFAGVNHTEPNLKDWQKFAGKDVSLEEISEVVYKFSIRDMVQYLKNPQDGICETNKFAKLIFQDPSNYAAYVLLLAKQIEQIRAASQDPWYYPASKNEGYTTLEPFLAEINQLEQKIEGLSEHKQFFKERLELQRVRVMYSLKQYKECIDLWNKEVKHWSKNSVMRSMIKDYVAGAYAQLGQKDKAYQYYWEQGNIQQMSYLGQSVQSGYSDFVRMMHKYQQDCSPEVLQLIQYELHDLGQTYYLHHIDSAKCSNYYDLAQHIIRSKKSNDMSVWYYTAAYLEDYMGQTNKAVESIRMAAKHATTPAMRENIRLMKFYLDAKTQPCNARYEQNLYSELQWIDQLIKSDTTNLRKKWKVHTKWLIWNNVSCSYDNQYYSYPYVMLRKTVLCELAPRMMQAGKTQLAIALTNYADNLLLTLMDPKQRQCYFNNFFMALDTLPAATVEQYAHRALNPSSELEKLLVAGGYVNKNYLYDIAGTLYLRERNYAKAMETLSRVNYTFEKSLRTKLQNDPFALEKQRSTYMSDYKYNFACDMTKWKNIYENTAIDVNRRADAMIKYALGMRNSYINTWGLTQYSQGVPVFNAVHMSWLTNARAIQVQQDYENLIKEALSLYTDDEAKAQAYLFFRNCNTVVTQYPNTEAAKFVRGHCDTYYDYFPRF